MRFKFELIDSFLELCDDFSYELQIDLKVLNMAEKYDDIWKADKSCLSEIYPKVVTFF